VQSADALDAALKDGVQWVRLGIIRNRVHSGPGQFNWGPADQRIAPLAERGVKILAILGESTTWDNAAPRGAGGRDRASFFPGNDLKYWREFVRETASRYRGKVAAYEIWNEPDPGSGGGQGAGPPAAYAAVVAAASQEIRAADPQALVVAGAFHGRAILNGDWVHQFWTDSANPPAQSIDAFSFHLIAPRQPHQDTLDAAAAIVRTLRQDWGVDKPLWLTEVGYSSNPKFQDPPYTGDDGQARWVADTLPPLLGLGVERLFWALLQDESATYGPDQAFGRNGLLDGDQPKPAYGSFLSLLSQ
jgi:hypothetical protein